MDIKLFLKNPERIIAVLLKANWSHFLKDDIYLNLLFFSLMRRKWIDWNNPQGFNEKLQWLKVHDHKPEYTIMVDKYAAKQYVADRIGEEYIIPTLGIWEHFDDIDFDSLPNQFVLKCTHDSGGLVICKDKRTLNKEAAKKKIEKCLKRNYYWSGREWPYKNVPPRIIAEKYMSEDGNEEINDYKLMCFNSKVKATFVCSNRFSDEGLNVTFYDADWKRMPFERHYPASSSEISKPKTYEEMVLLAERLAQQIPFLHVDFYEVKGKPYFGDLTFFPGSGFEEFNPDEWDKTLGEWIKLPGGDLICNEGYTLWIHTKFTDEFKKEDLKDYKFYCFDGKMQFVMINSDRNSGKSTKADYFDREFNWLDFTWGYEHAEVQPKKPDKFDEMVAVAEKLAKGLPHIRVDLYECNGQIYFGELTFFDGSGFDKIEPEEWEYKIGNMLELPPKKV